MGDNTGARDHGHEGGGGAAHLRGAEKGNEDDKDVGVIPGLS